MMFEMSNYIGKHVRIRRITVIGKGDSCLPLFCVVDAVEEEMQDYACCKDEHEEVHDCEQRLRYESYTNDLTDELLLQLGTETKATLLPLHLERDVDEIKDLLPLRQTSAFVRVYDSKKEKQIVDLIGQNEGMVEKLKYLSEKYFGYDITQYKQYFGKTIVICYNPIHKSVDLTEDGKKGGLYFRVNYWKGRRDQLKVEITGKDKDKTVLMKQQFVTESGMFLSHFDFERNYPLLDINVIGPNGEVIDYYRDVAFIHSISVNINMKG